MKGSPKVGTTGEQMFAVERSHAIDFADGAIMISSLGGRTFRRDRQRSVV